MRLENADKLTPAQRLHEVLRMDDATLQAQELVQKGAMHVLTVLLRVGCTEANARSMLDSCGEFASKVSAECRRRGLGIVDDPRGN